jgi:hypothetical protein
MLTSVGENAERRHPFANRPLINNELMVILLPSLLAGTPRVCHVCARVCPILSGGVTCVYVYMGIRSKPEKTASGWFYHVHVHLCFGVVPFTGPDLKPLRLVFAHAVQLYLPVPVCVATAYLFPSSGP